MNRPLVETIELEPQMKLAILSWPWTVLGSNAWKAVSAPGRMDFLNTHQDYKGLPVIPAAVSLRTYAFGKTLERRIVKVKSIDLMREGKEFEDEFELNKKVAILKRGWFGNYFRGVIRSLLRRVEPSKVRGLEVVVRSQVPIGSGLSSSAALEVSIAKLIDHMNHLDLSLREIAEIAFEAENRDVRIPCGRLDQYSSAFGGLILLNTREPYEILRMKHKGLLFVVVDSGIRHFTGEIHPQRQREINLALLELLEIVPKQLRGKLGERYDEVRWEEISEDELSPFLEGLEPVLRNRIRFTLRMQASTNGGLALLKNRRVKISSLGFLERSQLHSILKASGGRWLQAIGEIMNYQHTLLRDLYDVSHPKLETIHQSMLNSGALGVKISGAGLGGALIALVPNSAIGRKVVKRALEAGASKAWITKVGTGVRVEVG